MAHLICYEILMGPIRFFCPGPIVCLSRPCLYHIGGLGYFHRARENISL